MNSLRPKGWALLRDTGAPRYSRPISEEAVTAVLAATKRWQQKQDGLAAKMRMPTHG